MRARWELATVWQPDEKAALTAQINALFVAAGDPPLYSVRKLEDWLSNARYRANCKKRTRVPSTPVKLNALWRAGVSRYKLLLKLENI